MTDDIQPRALGVVLAVNENGEIVAETPYFEEADAQAIAAKWHGRGFATFQRITSDDRYPLN